MRLIDADKLCKDIVERGAQLSGCYSAGIARYMDRMLAHVLAEVDIAPAVDAVPVVRCKDCKHWQPSEYGVVEQPYCKHLGYKEETGLDIQIGNENDYCSFGERKDDD